MKIFTFLLLLSTWMLAKSESPVITQISSAHLIEGEVATFDIIFRDRRPSNPPAQDLSKDGLTIADQRDGAQNINGEKFYIYQYSVVAQTAGKFTIPAYSFESKGKPFSTLPIELNVVPLSSLHKVRFDYKGEEIECYSQLFINKSTLYPSEATELEYKIYVPRGLNTQSWGHPKAENSFNCTAWRFEGPSRSSQIKQVIINNSYYETATYTTTLSANKAGDASFGPLETVLTIAPGQISSPFGFSRRNQLELPISTPAPPLTVLPYPAGMPASFDGAVGSFTLEASFESQTSIHLNDSITASVSIAGKGNLDEIKAPTLEDTAHWDVIDVSRVKQGEERKQLNGVTEFSYILQPKRGASALPRFTFSHFDPSTKKFHTETTETSPIELLETQSTGSVILPEAITQTENMQDILAPLASVSLSPPVPSAMANIPVWWWQLIPASAFALILFSAISRKKRQKSEVTSEDKIKQLALKKVESSNDTEFLKLAGSYAEQWLDGSPEALKILEQRDTQCYHPTSNTGIDTQLRQQILSTLKKFSLLTLIACIALGSDALAADDGFALWQKGDNQAALDYYRAESAAHPESADLLYNIGTSHYRLGHPGTAAVYFARALKIDPSHHEAAKNLRFTQKTQGAIQAPELSNTQQWLARLPAELYKQAAIGGLWTLLLALCYLKLLQPKRARFGWGLTAVVLSPLLALVALFAWLEYPHRQTSDQGDAAMVTAFGPVLTEPIDVSGKELEKKTLINATPSSACQILATRDQWSYVQLANGTRGWLPSHQILAL